MKDSSKTAASSLMSTIDGSEGNPVSVVNKYLKRALQRITDKQSVRYEKSKENYQSKALQDQSKSVLAFSSEKLKEIKMTNEKLQRLKENLIHEKKKVYNVVKDTEENLDKTMCQISQSFDQRKTMYKQVQIQALKQTQNKMVKQTQNTALQKSRQYASHCRQRSNTFLTEQMKKDLNQSSIQSFSNQSTNKSFNQLRPQKSFDSKKPAIKSLESTRSQISVKQQLPMKQPIVYKQPVISNRPQNDPNSLASKMSIIKAKVSKYMKEINFKTVVNLKRQVEPSKSCFNAAKCLCQLLNSLETKHRQPLNEWNDIKNYISSNQYQIMQDIYNLKSKIEKKEYNLDKVKAIYSDIFQIDDSQVQINSPRIKNIEYRSIFCLCFFLINQILLSEQMNPKKSKEFIQTVKKSSVLNQSLSRLSQTIASTHEKYQSAIKLKYNEDMPLKRIPSVASTQRIQSTIKQRPSLCQSNKKAFTSIQSPTKRVSSTARKHNKSNSMTLAHTSLNIKDTTPQDCYEIYGQQEFAITLQILEQNQSENSDNEFYDNIESYRQEAQDESEEIDIDLPIKIELKENNKNDIIEAKPIFMNFQQQPTVITYDSPNSKLVSPVKKMSGTMKLEGILQDWQNTNEAVTEDKFSQDKFELIQKLKQDRKHSCERKRGHQLEQRTMELIRELSKTIDM